MRKITLSIIMVLLLSLVAHSEEGEKGTFSKELFEQFIGHAITVSCEGPMYNEQAVLIDVKDDYLVLRSSAKGRSIIFIRIDKVIQFYIHDHSDIESFYRKKK